MTGPSAAVARGQLTSRRGQVDRSARRRGSPALVAARRRRELMRGNRLALIHGVFADVASAVDIATEIALLFASRPALDPIADRRLVEQLTLTSIRRRKVQLAMEGPDGMSAILTSYDARLAPLEERLERQVHERDAERRAQAAKAKGVVDLERYRPGGSGT